MSYRRRRGTDPLSSRELLDMPLNKTNFERNSSLEYYSVSHDLFCKNKKIQAEDVNWFSCNFEQFWLFFYLDISLFSVINHCYDEPCKNNGSCVTIVDSYQCTCPATFTGPNCEGKHTRLCLHSLSELFTLHRNLSDTWWTISEIGVVQLLSVTEIAPKSPLLGSVSNEDGDGNGNENAKKAMGLLSKTTTLHVHHAFLYISLPSLHDYHLKMPDFTLYGGRNQATTNVSFFFQTWVRSPRNQL